MQTVADANKALSEVHSKYIQEESSKIFDESIYVTILLPKSIRKEKKAEKHSQVADRFPHGSRPQVPYNPNRQQDQQR
jgi:hypothetical protein